MLQTATIWTALNFLLATEIRSDILAGCSSEIMNTSNSFCVEEMHLYSDCRADAIKSLQDCRWAEIMQLRSAAEIHFLQDWELPPLPSTATATTAIHWEPVPSSPPARQSSSINGASRTGLFVTQAEENKMAWMDVRSRWSCGESTGWQQRRSKEGKCVREENLSFDVFSSIQHSRGSWTDMDQRHKSEPCGDLETS